MPKYTRPRRTWAYEYEFKARAIRLNYVEGLGVTEVAESLDIRPYVLSRRHKEYREGKSLADRGKKLKGMAKAKGETSRMKKLDLEVALLKLENDLLLVPYGQKVAMVSSGKITCGD